MQFEFVYYEIENEKKKNGKRFEWLQKVNARSKKKMKTYFEKSFATQ